MLAPAKVNLTLHVTGRRSDGYHRIDSLVAFADLGDVLTVAAGDDLRVTGPFAAGVPIDETNLIWRALAVADQSRAVTLEKNLPHPAGIGGGSSDAAAVLRAVGAQLSTGQLLSLGADVPVCMAARATRMRGIGDVLTPLELPALPAVLVNPGVAVPTGDVFAALRSPDNPGHPASLPQWSNANDVTQWLNAQRNDLAPPACRIAPIIDVVLADLRAAGATLARMSGSGATCFGLFPSRDIAEAAARALGRADWWVRACTLT